MTNCVLPFSFFVLFSVQGMLLADKTNVMFNYVRHNLHQLVSNNVKERYTKMESCDTQELNALMATDQVLNAGVSAKLLEGKNFMNTHLVFIVSQFTILKYEAINFDAIEASYQQYLQQQQEGMAA